MIHMLPVVDDTTGLTVYLDPTAVMAFKRRAEGGGYAVLIGGQPVLLVTFDEMEKLREARRKIEEDERLARNQQLVVQRELRDAIKALTAALSSASNASRR